MSINKERIEKVVEVLAKAACKEYQHRVEVAGDAADDDFLQIEVGMTVVLEDLEKGELARQKYVAGIEKKNQEISDRAAMLVVQDPHVVGDVMMKLAGGTSVSKMDYEQFLEQGREFKKTCDDKALDKFWATIINAGQTHPFPIWRVSEIIDWTESGEYEEVMKNN